MSQTVYNDDPVQAVEGQLFDNDLQGADIVSYPCSEDISAGRLLSLVAGAVREHQEASLANVAGIAIYKPGQTAAAIGAPGKTYKLGEMVPCMRSGRVFVAVTGSAPAAGDALNVNSNAVTAASRGKLTTTAVAANIFATPVKCFRASSVSGLTVAEINLP